MVMRSFQPPAHEFARVGSSRRTNLLAAVAVGVLGALVPLVSSNAAQLARYEDVLIALLVVIGLNISFGYAGLISLGQPVIAGAAAYMAGVLNVTEHWSAWITLPFALVAGIAFSVVLNSVSLRLRGWYLAATTFFAVTVFPNLVDVFQKWTQGDNGLGSIHAIPGAHIGIAGNSIREYEIVLAITAVLWLACTNLVTSRWGLLLESLRDCHNGFAACGGNQFALRFTVTVVSAVPVAVAGWLTAHVSRFLVPTSFSLAQLLLYAGAVILGGRGTIWGPVVGTVVFEGISLWIGPFSVTNEIVLGVAVLVISAAAPVGLAGTARWMYAWTRDRWRSRQPVAQPVHRAGADPGSADSERIALLAPGVAAGDLVLTGEGLSRSFGGLKALDGVDLELRAGQITGLVGPNGSGKTTLLNVVTGFVAPDTGRVRVRGEDVTGLPAHQIARRGVRRSFQTPQLIPGLSLEENLAVGVMAGGRQRLLSAMLRGPAYRRDTRQVREMVAPLARLLGFDDVQAAMPVEKLSLGHRRIAEIGRAVVARPSLLCLDEPAAGLGDDEIEALATVLRRLAGMGFAILLIEHNLSFVRSISDSVISLESGRVVDELTPSYSADAIELRRAANVKRTPHPDAEPVLKVTELSAWYGEARALFDVSLSVQPGEVVGVLGDNGAGKSTLLRSIARLHRKTRGSVRFGSHEITGRSSQELSTLGVGLVREGAIVFPDMTVAEHLALARRLAERRRQPWRGEDAVYEWLPILGERRQTKAGLLSGGQRQLLALASAAVASPTCLLLDEPSAGLAESILETVFDFVRRIAADGVTLVIAEQSERWIADIADQIYWLEVGRMAAVGDSPLQRT